MDYCKIIRLSNDEYDCLVIMRNTISPVNIEDYLIENCGSPSGKMIIDQFLRVGNTDKRFLIIEYENNIATSYYNVSLKKNSEYRKISCDYLKDSEELESSILTSIQKRMIKKGITI